MVVEACGEPKLVDDMDEDDMPLVFKRSSSSAKQNQSNSETKKSPSQRPDQQLGRPAPDVRSQNGRSTTVQKCKTDHSSKMPPVKSPLASSKSSNSSAKAVPVKSSEANLKSSTSVKDEPNSAKRQIKDEKASADAPDEANGSTEDSDDDIPLSVRLSAGLSKVKSNHASKGSNASTVGPKLGIPKPENLDDEKPLASKYQGKSSPSASTSRPYSDENKSLSDDDKPLSVRLSAGLSKVKFNHASKGSNASTVGPKTGIPKPENFDDEKPLASKYQGKSNPSASTSRPYSDEKKSLSDDDKPLSVRLSAGLSKVKSNHASRGSNASTVGPKTGIPKPENFDDEKPWASKYQGKSNPSASTSRPYSDEEKSLSAIYGQNGSASTERKPSTILKRHADGVASAGQSNLKRSKLLDASASNKNKEASVKAERNAEDDEDHAPISQRMKKPTFSDKKSSFVKNVTKPIPSLVKKTNTKIKKVIKKFSKSSKVPPGSGEGQKWTTLVHNGVIFPPPYKPHGVKLLYKGKPVDLTPEQEEVATMYAVMLETEYMSKPKFKENFMTDWRKILGKNHIIQSLEDCDFTPIYEWHQKEKEKKKQMSTDEKKALKEEKLKQEEKYMWAIVDGVKEKVGNFRVEPPGLFRGRGEHPRMGKLKKRIRPSDITINIGRDAPIPECPIPGERWKDVRHDNTVTWLAYWNDPINQKEFKYVFLAASSSLKGQSDKEKYEKARLLKDYILGIRAAYTKGFASKDPTKKQIAVATYLIDKLALRAGNEKDDDEADTVGCCTLKVENVEPMPPNILKFDFLGKDSIRYQNEVKVEIDVFKAIQQFRSGKKGGDDLFDMLDTSKLNAHLKELMPGLTAKVFRTYNASITLDDKLSETKPGEVAEKVATYQHANKQVAIICNHQRAVSKSHTAQMSRLDDKINELKGELEELKTDLASAKKGKSADGKSKRNLNPDALERKIAQTTIKIEKMERDKESKEDLKTVALGTSKINYLDPRITVAWCKRHEVPIEKMFNKSLVAKFAWAMDVDPDFRF